MTDLPATAANLTRRIGNRLERWRQLLKDRLGLRWNHVFRIDPPFPAPTHPADFTIECHRDAASLDQQTLADLQGGRGDAWRQRLELEFRRGAVLWIGRVAGRFATCSMTRSGRHFRRWFVPLTDDDVVVFRNETRPEFRGRRLNPSLMLEAIRRETSGGAAFIDCRTDNLSSIRSIERTGFRRIATLRPPPVAGQFREDHRESTTSD